MAPPSSDVDEFFDLKNSFYIANYQTTINEALRFKKASLEKDIFMYRAYIAQKKYRIVLDEIKASDSTPLLALRWLAEYFSAPANAKENVIQKFEDKLAAEDVNELDSIWLIAAATIYYNENLNENVLKIVHGVDNLECMAFQLQTLLRMNRIDLAKKLCVKMQEKDDDATLTQLCQAWLNMQIGGEKLQDAYYIFQDFCDKFSPSAMLLNSQAVCFIGQQKYEEAEAVLRECLDKDSNNYDALVNLIVLHQTMEKQTDSNASVVQRYLSQLQDAHPNTPLVLDYAKKEDDFVRAAQQYTASCEVEAN